MAYAASPVVLHFFDQLAIGAIEVIDDNAQADGKGIVRCKVTLKDGDSQPVPWGCIDWSVSDDSKGLSIANSSSVTDDRGESCAELASSEPGDFAVAAVFGSQNPQEQTQAVHFKTHPVYIDSLAAFPAADVTLNDTVGIVASVCDGKSFAPVPGQSITWSLEGEEAQGFKIYNVYNSHQTDDGGESSVYVHAENQGAKLSSFRVVAKVGSGDDEHSTSRMLTFRKGNGGDGQERDFSISRKYGCTKPGRDNLIIAFIRDQKASKEVIGWTLEDQEKIGACLANQYSMTDRLEVNGYVVPDYGMGAVRVKGDQVSERGQVKVTGTLNGGQKKSVYVLFDPGCRL